MDQGSVRMSKLTNRIERLEVVHGASISTVDAIEITGITPGGAIGNRAIWRRGQPNFRLVVNDDIEP